MAKRKAISNKVRFEVFKRDSFKCQYCGASAPDVLLQVDHIKPVKEGGTNDLSNLITSCFTCNSGKGARALSDKSEVEKQRKQLEELNERREQLKMMMHWREELLKLEDEKVNYIKERFEQLASCTITEFGAKSLAKIIKKYPINVVLDAVEVSASQYLRQDPKGGYTTESRNKAFDYISRICAIKLREQQNPDLGELYYIRGILRNRLHYVDDRKSIQWLKEAYQLGKTIEELKDIALSVNNWTEFREIMEQIVRY
ncbi:HNH endonuclease [Desulfotomaculum sp. 1211_IL3151]|uniref:HNH endonuclease n=1 Tax=Desulfotomaculum sp. 1211_IL3151 TaxID=3084055 RepID=UPI002FDB14D0